MASNIRSASLPPGFELEENERDSFSALGPDLPEGFTLDVDQGDLLPGFELEQPAAPQPKLFPLTGGKTALGRQLYTTEAGELIGDRVVAITAPGLNGGKPTLVPLIHNGHLLPEQEAIQRVIAAGGKDPETGKPLPFYETPDEALSAMEKLNSAKPAPVTAVQIPDAVGGEGGVARPQSLQIPAGPLSALPAQPLPDPMAQQEVATDPDQATWRDFLADINEAAKGLPGALKSAAASAWEGNNPEEIAKAKDWADRVINERRARSDANFTMEGADDVYVDLGPVRITRADVRNLPENVAFSLVSLLGGLVAGGAGAFIGGPVGVIAGMAGGSGVAAYRMDTNQVLRQLRDGLDRAALRDIGRPLTDDEWLSIAQSEDMQAAAYRLGVLWSRTANPAEEVRKHGLHEAGWEAVGNAALFAAGKALYQLGKSRNLLGAKAAGAFVGGSAMEVLTEAETHIGQAGVETRLGLREGREPEYLNLHDQYEAIREVAGPTLMLTGVMGAGAAGAGAAVRTVQDLNQARILRRELDQANLGDPEAIARDALTPKPIRGWDAQGRPVMEEIQSPAYTAEVQPTPWGDELPEGFHLVDPNQVAQVSADASDSPGSPPPPASSTQTGVSAESTAAAQPEPISNAALQADRQTIAELERLAA